MIPNVKRLFGFPWSTTGTCTAFLHSVESSVTAAVIKCLLSQFAHFSFSSYVMFYFPYSSLITTLPRDGLPAFSIVRVRDADHCQVQRVERAAAFHVSRQSSGGCYHTQRRKKTLLLQAWISALQKQRRCRDVLCYVITCEPPFLFVPGRRVRASWNILSLHLWCPAACWLHQSLGRRGVNVCLVLSVHDSLGTVQAARGQNAADANLCRPALISETGVSNIQNTVKLKWELF